MTTLLTELCIKLGCCLKPEGRARMREMPTDDVDAFVAEFHKAEDLLEPYDQEHWRNVRYVVATHFARIRKADSASDSG